jgi:hypothetical protein
MLCSSNSRDILTDSELGARILQRMYVKEVSIALMLILT